MHVELDFRSLRTEIEAATLLPDFAGVGRRARRIRLRDRLAVLGALVSTLAIFVPIGIAGVQARHFDQPQLIGPPVEPAPDTVTNIAIEDVSGATQITVRAAGGLSTDSIYAATDVCVGSATARRCSLQVNILHGGTASGRPPVAANLLRQSPTDPLSDIRLVPMSPRYLLLSGTLNGRARVVERLSTDGLVSTVLRPTAVLKLGGDDRLIQLTDFGELYAVRQQDDQLSLIAQQPPLTQLTAVTAVSPRFGWWATGLDPVTGVPSVAVSSDLGKHWTVRSLDTPAGYDPPAVATFDGAVAFAFVRTIKGLQPFKTVDGGDHWISAKPAEPFPWPPTLAGDGALAGKNFGAVVRPDRSLLIWVEDTSAPVYLESTDGGARYRIAAGPSGRVVPFEGGYVALGDQPMVSLDASTWMPAAVPAVVPPD